MGRSQRLDIIPGKGKLVEGTDSEMAQMTALDEGTDSCGNCILNFQAAKIRGKI